MKITRKRDSQLGRGEIRFKNLSDSLIKIEHSCFDGKKLLVGTLGSLTVSGERMDVKQSESFEWYSVVFTRDEALALREYLGQFDRL